MFMLQSESMSVLMSSSLTGIKTAECLSGEKARFCVFSNKSDVAHQHYWHLQMTYKCGDNFIFASFSIG